MSHQATDPLQLRLMPCRPSLAPNVSGEIQSAYRLWEQMGREIYTTLGSKRLAASDQFTRQDFVAGIYHKGCCAGMVCFRRTNTSCAIERADSWFQPWPEASLTALGAEHPRGLIMSFLMVHPDYRRASTQTAAGGPAVSELVVKIASLVFLESGAQLGYGVTRNDRSVNKLAQAAGWNAVVRGVRHLGYDTDCVVLTQESARKSCAAFDRTILEVWENRALHANIHLFETGIPDAK